MKKRIKGFTLIELLAVIVILAIILLIAMPIVLNVINDAKKGALEASAMGLVRAFENQCVIQNNEELENVIIENEVITNGQLGISGKLPPQGMLTANESCEVAILVYNTEWCAYKEFGDRTLSVSMYNKGCPMPESLGPYCDESNQWGGMVPIGYDGYIGICNREELKAIEEDMTADYVLLKDIDLEGSFEPIGFLPENDYVWFFGTLDGRNHQIYNGTINYPSDNYIGLFAFANDALIKDLEINITVNGNNRVGGLAGYFGGFGVAGIENVTANVTISGEADVGGLVGYSITTIDGCNVMANVSGRHRVGGAVGNNYGGSIHNCYVEGNITGTHYDIGGLAGYFYGIESINNHTDAIVDGFETVGGLFGRSHEYSYIYNNYALGQVIGVEYVGGLIGRINNTYRMSNNYTMGTVIGNNRVGGLFGHMQGNYWTEGEYLNNYSYATVTGNTRVGGLAGSMSGSLLQECYFDGEVTGSGFATGGIAGSVYGISSEQSYVIECYNLSDVNGNERTGGVVGWLGSFGVITNSYNLGDVSGGWRTGGLAGQNWESTISYSYSGGNVTSSDSERGGLVGYIGGGGTVVNSYYDSIVSGQSDTGRGLPRTTTQMQQGFANSTIGGSPMYTGWDNDIWEFTPTNAYSHLKWQD